MQIAKSSQRVISVTDARLNQQFHREIQMRLAYYAQHTEEIPQRLQELEREWDIERVLETQASALTITGIFMSFVRGKKWLLLSAAVQGFFLQHALQGWCPPVPILRKLGVRTQQEIDEEYFGLKQIIGEEKQESRGKPRKETASR